MKKHNFSAGPAILPHSVFEEAAKAAVNFNNSGLSILEISHRSPGFSAVVEETIQLIKELIGVGENHHIMLLSGGASSQFYMVPMNYLDPTDRACYLDTGSWSAKAIKEAMKFGHVDVVASSKEENYTYIPKSYLLPEKAKYVHVTSNNTIFGTQIHEFPETDIPLVSDMSSDILSRKLDMERFGLIYAGAQKNLGPAGVAIVIMKKDWAERAKREIPSMLNYQTHIEKNSLFNTPPVFPIYVTMLNLRWLKAQGGVSAIQERNLEKATLLYDEIDRNPLFQGTARKEDRSHMNVTFLLNNESLNDDFLTLCKQAGIENIKGHRSVGGFRASMYNAMGIESTRALVEVMQAFEEKYG